jgi:hypothetical protein
LLLKDFERRGETFRREDLNLSLAEASPSLAEASPRPRRGLAEVSTYMYLETVTTSGTHN